MKSLEKVRLRTANDEDLPFIFNSWLKSYRNSHFAEKITNTIYFSDHHKVVENILKDSVTMIACNADDPTQMYGYAVGSQTDGIFVLHFIYVKHTFTFCIIILTFDIRVRIIIGCIACKWVIENSKKYNLNYNKQQYDP